MIHWAMNDSPFIGGASNDRASIGTAELFGELLLCWCTTETTVQKSEGRTEAKVTRIWLVGWRHEVQLTIIWQNGQQSKHKNQPGITYNQNNGTLIQITANP